MNFDKDAMIFVACSTTVPVMNVDNTVWFRGNDCATVLNYKDPKRAVKRHVDPEWQQTLQALLDNGGTMRLQRCNNLAFDHPVCCTTLSKARYPKMLPPLHLKAETDVWYHANTVAKECGYKDPKRAITMHVPKDLCRVYSSFIEANTGANSNYQNTRYINTKGVRTLIAKSKTIESIAYAAKLGVDTCHFKMETAEMATIEYLTTVFEGEQMEQQFSVGRFKIDLYFTDYKIAVECDEYHHKDRDAQMELERQEFITKQLGCRWVRFNPHHKTFSMAKVANSVFRAIMLAAAL